ncbi:hypothetical protein HRbin35_00567 [bacterium HR35]|nr:hypothetical protein HRbin35_00567 [bacterium HR35]
MSEEFKPGGFLKKRYWGFEDFRNAVARASKRKIGKILPKPEEQIPHYIQRIIDILKKERGKELFKKQILYKRFIIKPERIPEDYFKNVLLGNFAERLGYTREQLKDPQIRQAVIKLFEERTGQSFETYQIPKEEKEQLIQQIIEDQKRSLDRWFDYLTSPEAENYPPEFRYWVFAEVLGCGNYDEERKEYNERTKTTVAPFPELNSQALALLINELIRKEQKKPSGLINLTEEQRKEWQNLIHFSNGIVPRVAIVFNRDLNQITEIRGIAKGQNLDPYIAPIVEEALTEGLEIEGEKRKLAGSERYLRAAQDMRRLAEIYIKHLQKQELTSEELRFLYEIDREIIGFGYERDPRIEEILRGRDLEKDLAKIFDCREDQIALEADKVTDETVVLWGDFTSKIAQTWTKFPNNLKFIRGDADFRNSQVEDLGNLRRIGGNAYLGNSRIKTLKNLEEIGGYVYFANSQVEDLGNLRRIGRSVTFVNSRITTLNNLEEIGEDVDFRNSQVKDLGNLRRIRGSVIFANSKITTLKNLEEIGGYANFRNSQVEDLGNLRRIMGDAIFTNSIIKTLNNLEEIGGYAGFENSQVEDLGNLRRIGWNAYFGNAPIKNLGRLEEIGGSCYVSKENQELIKLLEERGFGNKIIIYTIKYTQ